MADIDSMVPRNGVVTLGGYGLRLAVERGHLVIEDGIADRRRRERFSRVDRELKRVVIIGHSGMITLDAIAWLQGVGVPLIHLDHDARVYFVSSPAARTTAQLRRAQALAGDSQLGFLISRDLVLGKIEGQLQVLAQVPDSEEARAQLAEVQDRARRAPNLKTVKDLEAKAARAYWRAWRRVPIQFVSRDAKRRPSHWRSFGSRYSPLAGESPRKAVNPANAVLNYLYAILEAEATIAVQAARLDPALGLLHTDRVERPSFVCDLMEPVRPLVDTLALSLFRERQFTKDDVFERHDGHCRLMPSVTRQLASTAPLWAQYIRPVVDHVAKALVTSPKKRAAIVPGVAMPRKGSKRQPRGRTSVVRGFEEVPGLSWTEVQGPVPGRKGTRKWRHISAANRAWDLEHGPANTERYRRELLPRLAYVPLRVLQDATGLSKTTCSEIRRGLKVPHARHWEGLREMAR